MVSLKDVRNSNGSLQALPPGLVAVFAGATAGIGLGTLKQFAKHTNGPRVYIIGRSRQKGAHIVDQLKVLNPMGSFVFIEGQFSLIREVDRISEEIKKLEDHIDILCMSPGYLSWGGRKDTPEGIETDLALQYYSRQRLAVNLVPLLERSNSPRVISILMPGFEGPIDTDDLERKNHYNFIKASLGAATMTDLMFEEIAKRNPTISFVHAYPGKVGTHIVDHMLGSAPGLLWYPAQIPRYTIVPLFTTFICISPDEAGERTLFLATSCKYPPAVDHPEPKKVDGLVERPRGVAAAKSTVVTDGNGNGVYRVNWNGESWKDMKMLEKYRQEELGKTVYEHTMSVFEKALRVEIANESSIKERVTEYVDSDWLGFDLELE